MSTYTESYDFASEHRKKYSDTLQDLINKKRAEADGARREYRNNIAKNPEACRGEYYEMLGWPLTDMKNGRQAKFTSTYVGSDELCEIYRLTAKILGGLEIYALLLIPVKKPSGKIPCAIVQHGGGGTPELIGGLYESGSANYNDMGKRIVRRGYAALLPQHLLWFVDQYGTPYDRASADNSLKQLGSSITAIEVYNTMIWTDYLESKEEFDMDSLCMAGLSYGGFYTLMCAAAETRIKAAYSSCFFNDRYAYNWLDWSWKNAAYKFFDAEICALIFPRKLYVEIGKNDELFDYKKAEEHIKDAEEFFAGNGYGNNIKFKIMEKSHEFDTENEGIEFILFK